MKNLEQVRAYNANLFAIEVGNRVQGSQGGEVIKKIPPLILNHGLLATAAYSFSEKSDGWELVFDAIAKHLADPQVNIVPASKVKNREQLLDHLTAPEATSEMLKRATNETMAWLQYARRFVKR